MPDLLQLYDSHLRTSAEMQGAIDVTRIGPLWLGRFGGGQLFITYRELDDPDTRVRSVLEVIETDDSILEVEWKTRTHDNTPGLAAALSSAGFDAEEAESVMIGEASVLAEAEPPPGVEVRILTAPEEMRAALEMQDAVFGRQPTADRMLTEILERQARGDAVELWAAQVDGRIVSAGRIDPIAGTAFAGIWGGATLPGFRARGIYRGLTAARVRSVMERGVRWIHSDSTDDSRPILERSGMVKVTETVPWTWHRDTRRA